MSALISRLRQSLPMHGHRIALQGERGAATYAELLSAVDELAEHLRRAGVRRLGLYGDNSPAWALLDLAALAAGICCVPLPRFFSDDQIRHAAQDAGLDALACDDGRCRTLLGAVEGFGRAALADQALTLFHLPEPRAVDLPAGTVKITYTSGSTGEPKGVCLGDAALEQVSLALLQASTARVDDRHLSLLPLSTLLENIGGIYVPLLAGATSVLLPAASVGVQGASGFDALRSLAVMNRESATTTILVPQMMLAWIGAVRAGVPRPASARFMAVGGASVSERLLEAAHQAGMPVYEGYGLSECASVVALNPPRASQPGCAGLPLPGLQVSIADDGEILVAGRGYLGYVGQPPRDPAAPVATGDLGHLDADGYLHVTGRKKNLIVTAYGRNVSPEWVERELLAHPAIAVAVVHGEARPWNVAVILPRPLPGVDAYQAVRAAIAEANRRLPDYAQVREVVVAEEAFTPENGLLTTNGRPRRQQILARYGNALDALYPELVA